MKDSLNIAIAGATGYVGLELIKILSNHPKATIVYLCAQKSIGKSINVFDKRIKKKNLPKISEIKKINWNKVDILFTALPNGEAQKIAKQIPDKIKLIDLSADFRLNSSKLYKKWYGINHNCKKLIKKSIYAITEFSRNKLCNYNIIACPGCYPTSVQLPLIPLVNKKMIDYFTNQNLQIAVRRPLALVKRENEFDIKCTVKGGGLSGQAGAIIHGIARALVLFEPDLKPVLKKEKFTTRDSRAVERKKYGHRKARRSFQFSKR